MKQTILVCTLLICSMAIQAQPVAVHGQLKVVGTQLMDKNNAPVALHGMSFGWHNLWPRFYNAGAVNDLVQDWKCTVVRASMGIELNDKGYLKDPAGSERLIRQVVDACIAKGVYVIIDWHDHNIHQKAAVKFFKKMAQKYHQYPNVLYEIYNEPDQESWPEVKAYSIAVINAIRQYDKNNIILVGSPQWDQSVHLPAADPIQGYSNLMYTMHFYAGTHKQWLRDRTDTAMQKGLPIFVSECAGMEATGDGPLDKAEWKAFADWMDSRGLSWIAWSVSDKIETCSVLHPSAASDGGWKETDIKEWGQLAKTYLAKYR